MVKLHPVELRERAVRLVEEGHTLTETAVCLDQVRQRHGAPQARDRVACTEAAGQSRAR